MIFIVDFETFKRLTIESTTGHIMVRKFVDEIGVLYEMFTANDYMKFKTSKLFTDVQEAIMFETSFLVGTKVVWFNEIEDNDIVLNITKG